MSTPFVAGFASRTPVLVVGAGAQGRGPKREVGRAAPGVAKRLQPGPAVLRTSRARLGAPPVPQPPPYVPGVPADGDADDAKVPPVSQDATHKGCGLNRAGGAGRVREPPPFPSERGAEGEGKGRTERGRTKGRARQRGGVGVTAAAGEYLFLAFITFRREPVLPRPPQSRFSAARPARTPAGSPKRARSPPRARRAT